MIPSCMNRQEVVRLTEEYGGPWLVGHAHRLLQLIPAIAGELKYDPDVAWLAAWMHDWGVCPKWTQEGVSHCRRSREVAEQHLRQTRCPKRILDPVLEAIEYHHGGCDERCPEAILLNDADALDSLGVLGVLKEFAMIPAEMTGDYCLPSADFGLRDAYERIRIRRENLPRLLRLESSRELAKARMADMDAIFAMLERDTFGHI